MNHGKSGMQLSGLLAGIIFLMLGCAHTQPSLSTGDLRIQKFLVSHKAEAKHFVFIRVANTDRYIDLARISNTEKQAILGVISKRFDSNADLVQFISRISATEQQHLNRISEEIAALKVEAGQDGVLCEYEMRVKSGREWGFLILKNGQISKKIPWGF